MLQENLRLLESAWLLLLGAGEQIQLRLQWLCLRGGSLADACADARPNASADARAPPAAATVAAARGLPEHMLQENLRLLESAWLPLFGAGEQIQVRLQWLCLRSGSLADACADARPNASADASADASP